MDRWAGKIAVVTGASVGIGAAIAVALANAGVNVVGLARRPQLIEQLKDKVTGSGQIYSRACDIGKPEEIASSFAFIHSTYGGIDILINNAALIFHGDITDFSPAALSDSEIEDTVDVNLRGAILCARHAVCSMKKNNFSGHVVNINSIAGHYVPFQSILNIYPSTKYGITAFSAALLAELAQYGQRIRVTSISPGIVETQMSEVSRLPDLTDMAKALPKLRPSDIADAVIYAISAPSTVNISEIIIQPVGEKRI